MFKCTGRILQAKLYGYVSGEAVMELNTVLAWVCILLLSLQVSIVII